MNDEERVRVVARPCALDRAPKGEDGGHDPASFCGGCYYGLIQERDQLREERDRQLLVVKQATELLRRWSTEVTMGHGELKSRTRAFLNQNTPDPQEQK